MIDNLNTFQLCSCVSSITSKTDVLMTSANKVSDLFNAAGEAFTKLAALAQVIQTSSSAEDATDGSYSNHDSSSWTVQDTELLHSAVKRFGDDLSIISENIKDKTMSQIKSTFKRLQSNSSNKGDDSNVSPQFTNSTSKVVSNFDELDNLRGATGTALEISCSTSESIQSSLGGPKKATKQSNSTSKVTGANSTITNESSVNSTQINSSSAAATSNSAASICPSPSPFLHYPLLRRSAEITLNRLNARDDSDEEDRKAGLSVFNST